MQFDKISYLLNEKTITKFTLNDKEKTINKLDERFFKNHDISKIPEPSINNQLKIRALMNYFDSVKCDNDYSGYNYKEVIYDNILSNLPCGFNTWYDPVGRFTLSSLLWILRIYSFCKRILNRLK